MNKRAHVLLVVALSGLTGDRVLVGQDTLMPDAFEPAAGSKSGAAILWRDPGPVEQLDFTSGPGGQAGRPEPPFRFVDEVLTGSNPKIRVDDAKGVRWMVKFGDEVGPQTFAARLAWAVGYFALPTYYVAD